MNRQEQLNNGLIETKDLNECLHLDQLLLFKKVIPQYCDNTVFPVLFKQVEDNTNLGIVDKMRFIGKILATELVNTRQESTLFRRLRYHYSDTVRGWSCFMLPHLSPALSLDEYLHKIQIPAQDSHFSVREWAWLALRENLVAELDQTINAFQQWVISPNPYLRRFAIESIRPHGLWCKPIAELKTHPEKALPLLEHLKSDPEIYVQDSVANWLNDASKSQPQWVITLCQQWKNQSDSASTQRIIQRALRTLNTSHTPL